MMRKKRALYNMIHRIPFPVIFLVFCCLLSAGCSMPGQGPQSPELTGITWVLISYNDGGDTLVPVPLTPEITLSFGIDGRVHGNAGCNDYLGTYRLDGGLMNISPLASTEKYCLSPEGIMDLEQQYLSLLQQTTRYHRDGDKLVLSYYDTRRLLIFGKS